MKRYYNTEKKQWYTEGKSITLKTREGVLFSGVPSEEQLAEWGYTEYTAPGPAEPTAEEQTRNRMSGIRQELIDMDYLTSKYIDGEDMTEYGDWQAKRKALREEYRTLEESLIDNNNV